MNLQFVKKELRLLAGNFTFGLQTETLQKQRKLVVTILLSAFIFIFGIFFFLYIAAPPHLPLAFYIKRAEEKTILRLLPTNELKIGYLFSLQERRLAELTAIVAQEHYECLLACSQRYSGNAGDLTTFIIQAQLNGQADETITLFTRHQIQLEKLVSQIPKDQNLDWRFVQDTINYLDLYRTQLSELSS